MQRVYKQRKSDTGAHRWLHCSWRIAFIGWGIIIGTCITAVMRPHTAPELWWLAPIAILLILSLSRPFVWFTLIALVAGTGVGIWRSGHTYTQLQEYSHFIGETITLHGTVAEDTGRNDNGQITAKLNDIRIHDTDLTGSVWVSFNAPEIQDVKRSDRIALKGKLSEGFGNMPASMHKATLVSITDTSDSDYALAVRDWFTRGIEQSIPEPAASLGSGFLTGKNSDLPEDLENDLRATGLTHAVVASGSNLTILVGFTRRLFNRASKYTATAIGAATTAGFVLVAGFSPSMTRAALVTGLSLLAWYYGRRIHPLVLLPMAAGITLIYDPSYLWGDIGWYLSFTAFAGVLILAPLLQSYFWGPNYKPNLLIEILLGTTAAQLTTMPVILYSFGTLSPYALIANVLVLPFIPLAMGLTFLAGISALAIPMTSDFAGIPATILMEYMIRTIAYVASMPSSQIPIQLTASALVITCIALLLLIVYLHRRTGHQFSKGTALLIGDRP